MWLSSVLLAAFCLAATYAYNTDRSSSFGGQKKSYSADSDNGVSRGGNSGTSTRAEGSCEGASCDNQRNPECLHTNITGCPAKSTITIPISCQQFEWMYNNRPDGLMEAVSVEVSNFRGMMIPSSQMDGFEHIEGHAIRDDDVILTGFRKSGTHWTWEILNMIVSGKAEYATHWKNSASLLHRPHEDLFRLESPRVLTNHLMPQHLPSDVWTKNCKIVIVERNPKDCAVSLFSQFSKQIWKTLSEGKPLIAGTWNDFTNLFISDDMLYGSWFDYTLAWNKAMNDHPNKIHKVYYEDLKRDCATEVKNLSEFIGRPLEHNVCGDIADACTFNNLKIAAEKTKDQTYHNRWLEGCSGYFRKGIVGDWKNWFTVAQTEAFNQKYEEKFNTPCPY